MKLLLPDSLPLSLPHTDGVEVVTYEAARPVPAEHFNAEALVIWGSSRTDIDSVSDLMPRLRWVQTLSAGSDAVVSARFPHDVILTSGNGLHNRTVSEHTLALILALVRRLPDAAAAQQERRWARELGGVQPLHRDDMVTSLLGANVLVWGFGSIGQTLAPLLQMLGANVRGVARTPGVRAGITVVGDRDIESELHQTDVLVMILPSAPETNRALDAKLLAALPARALVVNVGRGSTVDEDALKAALAAGDISGAALDVTSHEPLPSDSPLWTAERLILTPHAAGGRPIGASSLIATNLTALIEGKPLKNVVAR